MIKLKTYQIEAKDKLIALLQSSLRRGSKKQLFLEAPTGAGKTVVMGAMLDEFTHTLPTNCECQARKVAYIWIAPNQLHIQSYERIKLFTEHSRHLHPIYWDEVDHTADKLEHGDILFVNWESVVNKKALMQRDTESRNGLVEVVRNTAEDNKTPVVLIIDEEHEHTGAQANETRNFLAKLRYDLEIRISATPNYREARNGFEKVQIERHRVVEDEMIKKDVILNPDVRNKMRQMPEGLTQDQALLQMALDKRMELKELYRQAGHPEVNPLLLIQLPNDNKETTDRDNETRTMVETYLADPRRGISKENGKLGVWLSREKTPSVENNAIANIDEMTEALIFKATIAKGWDCPRAAVLLIYRETQSATFTIQTVGRILRMPFQHHFANDSLNHGYVYTNIANDYIEISSEDNNYICKLYAKRVREDYSVTLIKQEHVERRQRNRLGSEYRNVLFKTFEEKWDTRQLQLSFEDKFTGKTANSKVQTDNRAAAVRNGINLEARRIMVQIPTDLEILFDNIETIEVDATHRVGVARTQTEVDKLFEVFCTKHVSPFAVYDSMPVLKRALIDYMNDYLNIFETDAERIILHSDNRARFETIIAESLRRYEKILQARVSQEKDIATEWHLPAERYYDSATHHEVATTLHALEPCYELVNASQPEKSFREYLDRQESVKWWYKNGDKGGEHFSIVYTNSNGGKANFYVDYIVRLCNGKTLLFDTKSPNGDAESVNKHNALREYIRQQNNEAGQKLDGGIIVQDGSNWLFAQGTIDTMEDKSGWTSLDSYLSTQNN